MTSAIEFDTGSRLSEQVDAARFLRSFFEAVARRDWPTVAVSIHATASLFTVDPAVDGFLMMPWDRVAPAFREWMERSLTARKFSLVPDTLAVQITRQSAIVTPRA